MNKKLRELFNALGLVVSAFAMMAVAIGLIYVVATIFHTHTK